MGQVRVAKSLFETTRWTLLRSLQSGDAAARAAAQERLFATYWPPVYAWLRRTGLSEQDAADATQTFFADIVLHRHLFEGADRARGRLRDLILVALKNFDRDRIRGRTREQRRLEQAALRREEQALPACGEGPDRAFEARWAMVILEEAVARCERHYRSTGRADYWMAFEQRVLGPAVSGHAPRPREEVASTLGFPNPSHVSVAVHTVKLTCRAMVEQVAAETVETADDREDECRRILALFS